MTTDSWGSVTKWIPKYVVYYFVCRFFVHRNAQLKRLFTAINKTVNAQTYCQSQNVSTLYCCLIGYLYYNKNNNNKNNDLPYPFASLKHSCFWLPEFSSFRLSILMVVSH